MQKYLWICCVCLYALVMNRKEKKFSYIAGLLILVFVSFVSGCDFGGVKSCLHRQKLPGPSIAVSVEDIQGERQTNYYDLAEFPVSRRSVGGGISQQGISINDETTIRLAVFKNEEDSTHPGNRLISLEITCNDEIVCVDDISWNMRDDLHVCGGVCWRVFLTNYEERTADND